MYWTNSPADVQLNCIDVVENIDRAVALGILATPAIAIDGKLVFTKLPSDARLRQSMRQAIGDARLKMA
jgi:protein-disulfide isomerase